jgi:hypothetical protein
MAPANGGHELRIRQSDTLRGAEPSPLVNTCAAERCPGVGHSAKGRTRGEGSHRAKKDEDARMRHPRPSSSGTSPARSSAYNGQGHSGAW